MKRKLLGGLAALGVAGLLTVAVAAPAEAYSYSRYSYCTGVHSSIDVRTSSYSAISVAAYSLRDGRYLGSRTGNGYRLFWGGSWAGGYGEDVRFSVYTAKAASSVSTSCTLSTAFFVQ